MINTGLMLKKGFTLIELLIVIAVLGILAVAVLAAINPIEQINRSRDTGSRSDAEQLISAIDRYYASKGYYPWNTGTTDTNTTLSWTTVNSAWAVAGTSVLDNLSSETGELKESYISRITAPQYNTMVIYNGGDQGNSTYVCFKPRSSAFEDEAAKRCAGTEGSIPDDLDTATNPPSLCASGNEWSCLP